MALKTGKLAARPGAVKLKFDDVADLSQMAPPPKTFGHDRLVRRWNMLGNDIAGDCVFAGTGHEIMLWNAEAGKTVSISDATALKNYSEFTGYDPSQTDPQGNNPTDQGTDVAQWLSQRRKIGFADDYGKRHKIGAYIALDPHNIDQLHYADYYFDGVGIGVEFPAQWMDIFQQGGRTWPALKSPDYEGGHYITSVAWRDGRPVIVTWGAKVELTVGGYLQNADEAYAFLTPEKLVKGVDMQGFSLPKLTGLLSELTGVK
jgi:hypothetical protein